MTRALSPAPGAPASAASGAPAAGPGWRLTVGSAAAEELIDADAVILAVPARPAARLLAGVPGASAAVTAFDEISYASMAIVTLAYPRSAFPGAFSGPFSGSGLAALGWSGYLVPAVDGRAVKAVTFSSVKWPHLAEATAPGAEPLEIVRCSVGRIGEEALLQRADEESGRAGRGRTGRRHRSARRSGRAPYYQVGRRLAAVHGRASGPGGADPGGRRYPARAGRLRGSLRGRRHTRLCCHGPRRGQSGDGVPPRWPTIVDMADEHG